MKKRWVDMAMVKMSDCTNDDGNSSEMENIFAAKDNSRFVF